MIPGHTCRRRDALDDALRACGVAEDDLPAVTVHDERGKLRVLLVRARDEEVAALEAGRAPGHERLQVWNTEWCPNCREAREWIADLDLAVDESDPDEDEALWDEIERRSGGRRVVPTWKFDDRMWAFWPSRDLLEALVGAGSGTD